MHQVGKQANSEWATTQGMRAWHSCSHFWGLWHFKPRSKFIWQQEWVEKGVNEQQQPQTNSNCSSSMFPVLLRVSREAAWQEEGSLSAVLWQKSSPNPHVPDISTLGSLPKCPGPSQLCCPVWEGLFSEALQAHGSERKGIRAATAEQDAGHHLLLQEFQCQPAGGGRKGVYRDVQPPGKLKADAPFPSLMSQVISLLQPLVLRGWLMLFLTVEDSRMICSLSSGIISLPLLSQPGTWPGKREQRDLFASHSLLWV